MALTTDERFDRLDQRLDRLENTQRELVGQIGEVHRDLLTRIETVNRELAGQIGEVHRDLSTRIEVVNRELINRVEAVNVSLMDRVHSTLKESGDTSHQWELRLVELKAQSEALHKQLKFALTLCTSVFLASFLFLIGLVFSAGSFYAETRRQGDRIRHVEERLDGALGPPSVAKKPS